MKMQIGGRKTILTVDDKGVERMKSLGWKEVKTSAAKTKTQAKKRVK
jgi:hypothetical protein